ncbi:MAG TPA: hypothetical protein VHH94_02530 [Gammaproteobacteria bacterium]|nr:hypothetical protein [Gammaproteobacteria bacterium]
MPSEAIEKSPFQETRLSPRMRRLEEDMIASHTHDVAGLNDNAEWEKAYET